MLETTLMQEFYSEVKLVAGVRNGWQGTEEEEEGSLEEGKSIWFNSTVGFLSQAMKVFCSQWVSPFSNYHFGWKAELIKS